MVSVRGRYRTAFSAIDEFALQRDNAWKELMDGRQELRTLNDGLASETKVSDLQARVRQLQASILATEELVEARTRLTEYACGHDDLSGSRGVVS